MLLSYGPQFTWVASASLKWAKVYEKQAGIENAHLMSKQASNIYQKSLPTKAFKKSVEDDKRLLEPR